MGREGRPPRPRGTPEVAAVGPCSAASAAPKAGTQDVGIGVALARSSSGTMSRAGEGGRDTTRSIEHRASVGPASALWEDCDTEVPLVSTALEFPATLGHGLDMRVRARPAQHGLGRPVGRWSRGGPALTALTRGSSAAVSLAHAAGEGV